MVIKGHFLNFSNYFKLVQNDFSSAVDDSGPFITEKHVKIQPFWRRNTFYPFLLFLEYSFIGIVIVLTSIAYLHGDF